MAAELRRTGDQTLPKRVGAYEAFLQIGAGGMARVYLAVHRGQPGKPELAVVKVLRPEAVEDEHVLSLFMDEARIAMRLSHPNVIRTREVIAEPPDYVLAMDFHDGQSLLHVLRRLGRPAVPLDEHVYVLAKVLAGLSYAHELTGDDGKLLGIVHRDVSPANVLVSYSGEVKLLDFGIAKATGALAATQDGVVKGKVGYAAPEQCLGKPADPRSDVYAVGVMLWEAIAGRRRASGETWQSVLQARLEDAEPQLEDVRPDAPKALAAIVRRAIARDPEARYATAREFQSDLEKYLALRPTPKVGPARLAAMLKPHFEQDRKEQQRIIEAFLGGRDGNASGQNRRLPLPGRTVALPKPAPTPRAPATPIVEEEQTSRIPVDAALLIMSRAEAPAEADGDSRPTVPPVAMSASTAPPPASAMPTLPPPRALPTSPPPRASSAPPVPGALPSQSATTAPPARNSTMAPPRDSVTSAPPGRASGRFTPLGAFPAADAYGVVTMSKPPPVALALASDAPPPPKKARVWPALVVTCAAIALAAFGVVTLRKGTEEHLAKAKEPAASEPPAAPAPAPSPPKVDTVKVRISVDPADATVKLDGHALTTNPFVSALPRDNDLHELTAYAEGCRDLKEVVHLNQDVDLLIALKRIRGVARSTAPRSAAISATAASKPATQAAAAPPDAPAVAVPTASAAVAPAATTASSPSAATTTTTTSGASPTPAAPATPTAVTGTAAPGAHPEPTPEEENPYQ